MVAVPTPIEIFCSYASADEAWRRKLSTHLSLLKRQGLISLMYDRLIVPGTDWTHARDQHLETASVILLLVSADFFASDYCYGIEMKRALARHASNEARVVPILVRPADWKEAPFAHLHVLPTDAKPAASWRNKDAALADIVAGIRRVIEDVPHLTASAPQAALPRIWNIPYPRNPFFLGRENELALIYQHLHTGQAIAHARPQAISGLGGIGKTQLALEYAYRYAREYQAVLWARAESVDALMSSYVALAMLLRLPERKATEQEAMKQAVKIWLQTHQGWLLILDNADELALVSDFLPVPPGGYVVLTTRAAATGRLAQRLELEPLLPELGALLLLRRAGWLAPDGQLSHAIREEQELAVRISQSLGGLPLALDQVGAYLEETGTNMADYWHIYEQYRAELLQERRGLVPDYPWSVATTWSLSFQRVEERDPAAAELLRFCAFLAPDAIAEEILTAGASFLGPILAPVAGNVFRLNQAIEALRAYSLLRRDPKGKMLSIHRTVQAVLQDRLSETERRTWIERAVVAVNAAFPHAAEHGSWAQCERLLPQALAVASRIEQDQMKSSEAGRLLYETAFYLKDRARYAEAEPLFQQALRIREQQLGEMHPEVATSLNGLALLYCEQGQYEEAEPLFQQALRIREQQLGETHPEVATSLFGLAFLYYRQGKYAEAEPLFRRALRIREQQLGETHPEVAASLNGLALLYWQQEKYGEAEPLFRRALRIREQQLGSQRPEVAASLNNLAILYCEQGKYAEAEPLFRRALRIQEQQLGETHPEVTWPLGNLADLYYRQGKYAEAEPLFQRALSIQEQVGPLHPRVGCLLNCLALLYYQQGRYAEAGPLFQRALHIREHALAPGHPDTAETMHNLARLQEAQGNGEEAKTWYARALAERSQAIGASHPKTTETRKCLITLLRSMGQHEEADQVEAAQPEP